MDKTLNQKIHAPISSLQHYSQYPRQGMFPSVDGPKCPSTDEWIKKMWYIYPMEYYLAIKEDKILAVAATWMELKILILNEVRKRQLPHDISYMWNLKYDTNDPIYKTETDHRHGKQTCGCQGGKRGMYWEFGVVDAVTFRVDKQWGPTT